ncbi:MAG: xanthine dehydrogenase family protein molybdopterin-binding subunit [Pseudomonadota bacterium]
MNDIAPKTADLHLSRRGFLAGSAAAAGALVIGFDGSGALAKADAAQSDATLTVNPFVSISPDGIVTVVIKHFEMGQGTTTGLATLVAEELDADWEQVEAVYAPADDTKYANLLLGAQGTGGSTAIANSYEQYRKAGAAARALIVEAAAKSWRVDAAEISIEKGVLSAGTRSGTFDAFVPLALGLTPPEEPRLKDPSEFRLTGDPTLRRKDGRAKTDGSALFALDIRRENMVRAVIARPPKVGATLSSLDDGEAKAVRGVLAVIETPRGVAVVAESTWAAIKGRDALSIEWDETDAETRSTEAIIAEHKAALDAPGVAARNDGDADAALADAARTVEAEFVFPYLAHAPMEPLNCVIAYDGQSAQVWDGCQFPALAKPTIAAILGLEPEKVSIETVLAGGSFGRRATPTSDYHAEAAMVVKALSETELKGRPVQLVWTREDDLTGRYYRPLYVQRVTAGIDAEGAPLAYRHKLAGQSILIGTFFEEMLVKDGIDSTSVEGANDLPYAIPNMRVDVRNMRSEAPVLWWRAVGHTHTAYSTELMLDMMAEAAGADPVDYRMKLLGDHPRHAGVLKLAAEKAGWGEPVGPGRGRGVALHKSFNSYVALVAEVTATEGVVKIDRVVCAVDCGRVINPDIVVAQMEGGIGYGIGAAMRNEITLTDGEVDQRNFPDYEPLRITDMPKIEVHIVASDEAPTGVGEPGTPPAAPALANAIFAATGQRIFELPMTKAGVSFA